jgi:ribosomal protein S18 acetylase RimI-like enzyme
LIPILISFVPTGYENLLVDDADTDSKESVEQISSDIQKLSFLSDVQFKIRLLTVTEWNLFKELRLECSQISPDSFDNTYEEFLAWSDEKWENLMINNSIFGAFLLSENNDELGIVGCIGFSQCSIAKQRHVGHVFSVYLRPQCRGKGIGKELFQTVFDYVEEGKPEVIQLLLSVGVLNTSAVKLYKSMGFHIYATEERRLLAANGKDYIDEHLMMLKLK